MSSTQAFPNSALKPAFALCIVIALLLAFASLAGLLFQNSIYPTQELRSAFLVNDAVNLLIGLPILLGSMRLTRGGSLAGLLLWPGALLYILYNYIATLIGVPVTWIFPIYLALVVLSAIAIFYLLEKMDKNFVKKRLSGAVPVTFSGWILIGLGGLFMLRALGMLIQARHESSNAADAGNRRPDCRYDPINSLGCGGYFTADAKTAGICWRVGAAFLREHVVYCLNPLSPNRPIDDGCSICSD